MLPPRNKGYAMSQTTSSGRRIVWQSVITVLSAAVLISAEVFGAAFAGGWALASLMGFGVDRRLRVPGDLLRRRRRGDGRLRAQRHARRAVHRVGIAPTKQREQTRAAAAARCCRIGTARRDSPTFFDLGRVRAAQNSCTVFGNHLFATCPISHVPVAACRSVGIRTRGRTAARSEIAVTARSPDCLSSEH